MPDLARCVKPLLWLSLTFFAASVALDATGWLEGGTTLWWKQLYQVYGLLIRCGGAALAAALTAKVIALQVGSLGHHPPHEVTRVEAEAMDV